MMYTCHLSIPAQVNQNEMKRSEPCPLIYPANPEAYITIEHSTNMAEWERKIADFENYVYIYQIMSALIWSLLRNMISKRRVWPVSRGCLFLLGPRSYLRTFRGSVLPCTRFCGLFFFCLFFFLLFFYFDYVLHIVNFAIWYVHRYSKFSWSQYLRNLFVRNKICKR
jgi:hypothetical protein